MWITAWCRLSKNHLLEFRIGEEPQQPNVFHLKVLRPLRLVYSKPTERLLPRK
jgi:hypothetical protein